MSIIHLNKLICIWTTVITILTLLTLFKRLKEYTINNSNISSNEDYSYINCSSKYSTSLLDYICIAYSRNTTIGNLCEPLCNGEISYVKCLGHGIKTVLLLEWSGNMFILKCHLDYLNLLTYNKENQSISMARQELVDYIQANYIGGVITERVSFVDEIIHNYNTNSDDVIDIVESKNMWQLVGQAEAFKTYLMNEKSVLPDYYGTCGIFWANEYINTEALIRVQFNNYYNWEVRAKIAIGFLDLIKRLEATAYGVLHLCDVQLLNFGLQWSNQGYPKVKVIDTDSAIFGSHVSQWLTLLAHEIKCMSNEDCSMFDCDVECNLSTQRCDNNLKSNNFKNICRKIFRNNLFVQLPVWSKGRYLEFLEKCETQNTTEIDWKLFSDLYASLLSDSKLLFSAQVKSKKTVALKRVFG